MHSLKGKMKFNVTKSFTIYTEIWQTSKLPGFPKKIMMVPVSVNMKVTTMGISLIQKKNYTLDINGKIVAKDEDEGKANF